MCAYLDLARSAAAAFLGLADQLVYARLRRRESKRAGDEACGAESAVTSGEALVIADHRITTCGKVDEIGVDE